MGCKRKGWIRKGGKGKRGGEKIIILMDDDDITYFVSLKTLEDLLKGNKEIIPLLGYD